MIVQYGLTNAGNDWWWAVDNLEVGTDEPSLSVTIDRDTGSVTLRNGTDAPVHISGYVITSTFEAFAPDNWLSIAENYDANNGGSVDTSNNWSELTQPDAHGDLSEADLDTGTGTTMAAGTTIDLGNAGTWIQNPTETDILFQFISNGQVETGFVRFVGNEGQPFDAGDFDFDGDIDETDWGIFRGGQHADMTTLSLAEAYQMGDLTGDLANNHPDFVAFKTIFNAANGAGAFEAMLAGVPEPSSVVLLIGAGLAWLGILRWPRFF